MGRWRGGKFWFSSYFAAFAVLLLLLILGMIPAMGNFARKIAADFFYPYISVSVAGRNFVADKALLALDKSVLIAELESCRNALAVARAKSGSADALAVENNTLRKLLELPALPRFDYVPAEVMLFDPLFWKEHFSINRGSDAGVVKGGAVIALVEKEGEAIPVVVGFIDAVSLHSAEVVTLYNPLLRVPVRLENSNAVGFLNGENFSASISDLAGISYLPLNGNYRVGEKCVTTDFDPLVPAGLRMGELAQLEAEDSKFGGALYRRGHLRPALPGLDSIRVVLVVIPNPSNGGER